MVQRGQPERVVGGESQVQFAQAGNNSQAMHMAGAVDVCTIPATVQQGAAGLQVGARLVRPRLMLHDAS